MTKKTGSWVEFFLGVTATSVFLGCWIFLLTKAGCFRAQDSIILMLQVGTGLGSLVGVMVTLYSFFDKVLFQRRGIASCCFFTLIGPIFCINVIGAAISLMCPCRCDTNPLQEGGSDLVIFVLESLGSFLLVAVLLVASLTA